MPAPKLVAAALGFAVALAAPRSPSAQTTRLPRTPDLREPQGGPESRRGADGHVDLQGIWDFRSATPLERPARFAGREFPTTWTRPWTVAYPMIRSDGAIYEFACHEGNYGLRDILSGARWEEKAAETADSKRKP